MIPYLRVRDVWKMETIPDESEFPKMVGLELDQIYMFEVPDRDTWIKMLDAPVAMIQAMVDAFNEQGHDPDHQYITLIIEDKGKPN